MELSQSTLLAGRSIDGERALSGPEGDRSTVRERYAWRTAAIVSRQLPWAAAGFVATCIAIAPFALHREPARLSAYIGIIVLGALECALAVGLTRSPRVPPARVRAIATLFGLGLIVNDTLYHVFAGGEAEVLTLGNLFLVFGFLAAVPWGGWPQLCIAVAACAGVVIGLLTTTPAALSPGLLVIGMVLLGALSVTAAVLTDRYRYSSFVSQEELIAAKEAAERASQARRDFVATVSHDLRTPVNIIFGMADMALDVAVTPEQRELVQTIRRAAGNLHALLNDLLDFSKIDAGVVDLAPRRFAVRPWLHGVIADHARDAAAKRVPVVATVDTAVPEWVVSDPDRLQQVLGNLVSNAVKFTDVGEVAVRLAMSTNGNVGAPAALRCEVRDTGIGIAPDESARVFEPFAQAAATSRSHGGSGLGLAICRRLAEQMGGTIGVESAVGRGSTFWFTVPLG